jgi:tetratricopeptide (TPR) repeat protein
MLYTRAAALLVLTLVPGVATAQGTIDPYFEFLMARRLEGEGNNAGALAALERAAAGDPQSAEVRAEIASFHYRRNQRELAEKSARAAVALDEKNVEGNRVLGLIFASASDNERNSPAQTATLVRDAIAHLERAAVGATGLADPTLNYTLGRLYLKGGEPQKAIQALTRVVNQNPNSVQGRISLAQAYAAAKDLKGAISTLEEIVADEPRVASTLAQYLEQTGQLKEAAESYSIALEVQPNNRDIKIRRIVVLYDAKDFARAATYAADAQRQHPDDPRFARLRASALFAAGEKTQAVTLLEGTVKSFPKDHTAQLALVDMYSDTGRESDAERVLRQVLVADPSNADALNYLGYMLAQRGEQLDEAIRLVTRALEKDPNNGAYLDSLGWAHFRKGDLAMAEKYLSVAAERLPRNPEVQDHLGDLYARRGRWQEAIDAWTRAIDADGPQTDRDAIQKKITDARTRAKR